MTGNFLFGRGFKEQFKKETTNNTLFKTIISKAVQALTTFEEEYFTKCFFVYHRCEHFGDWYQGAASLRITAKSSFEQHQKINHIILRH